MLFTKDLILVQQFWDANAYNHSISGSWLGNAKNRTVIMIQLVRNNYLIITLPAGGGQLGGEQEKLVLIQPF